MKTRNFPTALSSLSQGPAAVLTALALVTFTSCVKEDDVLQTQIIELRSALEQRTKELEESRSQLGEVKEKMQRLGGVAASDKDTAQLKVRVTELEEQLALTRSQASSAAGAAAAAPTIDMDAMASRLEDDLTRKAKQLRELVQKQTPGGRVDEISLKAIDYPAELTALFNSAITFNILAESGQRLRLMFPVTADLGGTWQLPTPAEVQTAYQQAKTQPAGVAAAPSAGQGGNVGGGLVQTAASTSSQVPSAPAPAPAGGSGMRQVDANTFVFDWGDARSRGAAPAAASAPAAPPSSAPAPAPVSVPVVASQAPAPTAPSAPAAAPPAPAPAPAAPPAPVMPVQQDITIRFD